MRSMDADVRCQVEGMFRSTLADPNGLLVRESCIEFLLSIGGTPEEAKALLKECDRGRDDTHISVTNFLDVLCGPADLAAGREAKDSVEQPPQTSEASAGKQTLEASAKEPPLVQTPKVQSAPERIEEKPQTESEVVKEAEPSSEGKAEALEEQPEPGPEDPAEEAPDKEDPNLTTTATTATAEGMQEDDSTATLPTPAEEVKVESDACDKGVEFHPDPSDMDWYYESSFMQSNRLVKVKEGKRWKEMDLLQAWNSHPIPRDRKSVV